MTNHFSTPINGLLLAVTVLGLIQAVSFGGVPGARAEGKDNPTVLPPASAPYGRTYAEWSKLWGLWYIPQTSTNNAINNCSLGQSGPVWFLEAFGSNCTVPAGKALFFPIIVAECSNREAPPFYGATAADRSACAKAINDGATALAATIDGMPVHNLAAYRFQSSDFNFTAPPDNLYGIPPGFGQSTADGYYLMVAPLPVGQHTIHFTGTYPGAPPFTTDTTYHLTVKPRGENEEER